LVFFSAGFSGAIGAPVAPVDSLPPGAIAPVPPSGAAGAAGAGGGGGGGSSFLPQPAKARVNVKRATIDHEVICFPILFTSFPQLKSLLTCKFYYITAEYLQEVSPATIARRDAIDPHSDRQYNSPAALVPRFRDSAPSLVCGRRLRCRNSHGRNQLDENSGRKCSFHLIFLGAVHLS
jgi:hypothetical protein